MIEKSYDNLLAEANKILSSMEKDSLSVDEISVKIKEAYAIIDNLKSKLYETEAQVNEIINT
ncbi:MAG: exodeoxyribonuclease VII small subunit, partial [Bdellovibrionota bacterium]